MLIAASCQSTPSSTACPPIVAYSREQQIRMADELATLPAGAMLREAMKDYAVLRDQVRACRPKQ